uniref:Uncharacterized protein n=1 Tax=Rhizophora mucronata TaxID=61149 RepID=A0A2P2N8I6_RHIMU
MTPRCHEPTLQARLTSARLEAPGLGHKKPQGLSTLHL